MVGMSATRGTSAGHEAPGGQRGSEAQPPAARTPAARVVTRPIRMTVTVLGRTVADTGYGQQPASKPFFGRWVLRAR